MKSTTLFHGVATTVATLALLVAPAGFAMAIVGPTINTYSDSGCATSATTFNVGDTVYVGGSGFNDTPPADWSIAGNNSYNGSGITPSAGAFCAPTHTVVSGDAGSFTVSVTQTDESNPDNPPLSANTTYSVPPAPEPTPTQTITVTGNTSAGENLLGWMFNRDTSTQTPFSFQSGNASIGTGSLFVPPITNTVNGNSDKFIGELFLLAPIANINGISYDFKIPAGRTTADKDQFYMSVYANFGESSPTKFYDCRYNVVSTSGTVDGYTTVTFDPAQSYDVTTRTGGSASPHTCPASPAGMDALSTGSSTIRVIALNVGDTSGSDTDISGYLDNVVVNTDSEITTYDFEAAPAVSGPVFIDTNVNHVLDGGESTYPTIQAAVDAAVDGDTIQATPGTYTEHVNVNKVVTINGANVGTAGTSTRPSAESIVEGSNTDAPFSITVDGVTIDGFMVRGGANGSHNSGISAPVGSVTIQNNIITDNAIGVFANCTGDCTITRNLFDGNNVTGSASAGAGIYVDSSTGLTISNNEFKNHTANNPLLIVATGPASNKNITVSGNSFHDNSFSNVYALGIDGGTFSGNTMKPASNSTGLRFGGADNNVMVTSNVITGASKGIYVLDDHNFAGPSTNSNIAISNNSLTGNDYGVNVEAASENNVTVNFNDLSNNKISVYFGESIPLKTLGAENNWFGCAAGPATTTEESLPESATTCGVVAHDSNTVDFNPWLKTIDLTGNNPIVSIIHNSDGVAVAGDTGLKVNFTATGANPAGTATSTIVTNNTASYNINAVGPNAGDTNVHGIALFANQNSTLTGNLTINTPTPPSSGGGGGGNGPIVGSGAGGGGTAVALPNNGGAPGGQVLGASTSTVSIGSGTGPSCNSALLLTTYMRRGKANNSAEVMKLQQFLNGEMSSGLPITGFFGPLTEAAVKAFQVKYAADVLSPWGITEPTGYVYKTTMWKINMILCTSLNTPKPDVSNG